MLFAPEVLHISDIPAVRQAEFQVLQIGDLALVSLPGEYFAEFGIELKARSLLSLLAPVGLANDDIDCVPTPEAIPEGGYETGTALSSWAAPEVGSEVVSSEVVDSVVVHIRQLLD